MAVNMKVEERRSGKGSSEKKRSNRLAKFLKTPKGYLSMILILLTALSFTYTQSIKGLGNLASAAAAALVIDFLIAVTLRRKKKFSDGGLLTGLIVGLVLSQSVPWYIAAATAGIAVLSKHLLKVKKKPIFNPAAAGLLIAIYLFKTPQSWWGGMSLLPFWFILAVVLTGFILAKRINKLPLIFTFLGTYFSLFILISLFLHNPQAASIFRVPYLNSAVFLAFFMLTDPPTSAVKNGEQVVFGVLAAVASAAAYLWLGGLAYLLAGLLTANLWKTMYTFFQNNKKQAAYGRRKTS